MTRKGHWLELGIEGYSEIFSLQESINGARRKGTIPDTVIILEHHPCFTVGRTGGFEHILVSTEVIEEWGIRVYETDRGGDVTYHGPGQVVCYPIIDLSDYGRDAHVYVRKMEELLIRTLASFGIVADRKVRYPGVWVGPAKIGAVGIGIRNWVTMHGVSLNVYPDMRPFSLIVPCGISTLGVTSMKKLLGYKVEITEVRQEIRKQFSGIFDIELEDISLEEMKHMGDDSLSVGLASLISTGGPGSQPNESPAGSLPALYVIERRWFQH